MVSAGAFGPADFRGSRERADCGAEVCRVERPGGAAAAGPDSGDDAPAVRRPGRLPGTRGRVAGGGSGHGRGAGCGGCGEGRRGAGGRETVCEAAEIAESRFGRGAGGGAGGRRGRGAAGGSAGGVFGRLGDGRGGAAVRFADGADAVRSAPPDGSYDKFLRTGISGGQKSARVRSIGVWKEAPVRPGRRWYRWPGRDPEGGLA